MTDQDHTHKYTGYTKPSTFELFLTELDSACNEGNEAAKRAIEEIAPDIAGTLKRYNKWGKPKICLNFPSNVNVLTEPDRERYSAADIDPLVKKLITAKLGPNHPDPTPNNQCEQEYGRALANFITDIDISDCSGSSHEDNQISHGYLDRGG